MAEVGIELQRKPWKVWMSSAPQPTAVLTTAYDLLKQGGSKLKHNLVILNENVYAATVFNGNFEQFYRYALDIGPATFDKRSKVRVEEIDLTDIGLSSNAIGSNDTKIDFYVQDKNAALYPSDIKTVFAVNTAVWKPYFRPSSLLNQNDVSTSYRADEMFTASVDTDENPSSSDIYVRETDEIFTSTMVFEDGKKAYTTVGINRTIRILKLILGSLLFNSNKSGSLADLGKYFKEGALNNREIENLFSGLLNAKIGDKPLLSYIYLWVKAPFCADYIDPKDFNQDLNQDADVTHRNLLLSNNYDSVRNNFNRYNEDIDFLGETSNDMLEKMSRPYCPMISPMKDVLSEKLMLLSGVSGSSISEKAAKLLEDSLKDDSIIGSVLVSPNGTLATDKARYTPFTYYDPESRELEGYYVELGKLPSLIGRDGNLTTDGRIMSPTIDELWYIIYKTILGHSDESSTYISLPNSNNYGGKDTSLAEAVKEYKWSNDDGKTYKGSPLSFIFKTNDDGEVDGVSVEEWVSNPDEHYINVHSKVQSISSDLTSFFDAQNEDVAGSRSIFKTGDDIALGDAATHSKEFAYAGREYGPRNVPLSLRELEAAIMGIKYNVDNNFVFESKTYATSGMFGKVEKDEDGVIIAGGSLYQMHRDYNANIKNPNTVFKMGADNTGDAGRDATFGDLNNTKETHANGIEIYLLDKKNKRTDKKKTAGMPLLVENYGKSVTLNEEQGHYTGADVYMAADGTWRYKAEHMRLPILRSRY